MVTVLGYSESIDLGKVIPCSLLVSPCSNLFLIHPLSFVHPYYSPNTIRVCNLALNRVGQNCHFALKHCVFLPKRGRKVSERRRGYEET